MRSHLWAEGNADALVDGMTSRLFMSSSDSRLVVINIAQSKPPTNIQRALLRTGFRERIRKSPVSQSSSSIIIMGRISSQAIAVLSQTVESACADPQKDIPGVAVVVVNKSGQEIFAHAAGKRGVGSDESMTLNNIFWIASCTKMIAGIACMQLVERGVLALDDSNMVEKLCPELRDVKVLESDGKLVEKKRGITLRMLLTHTGK
jgi:CubicO group peptidase (beta-lactamase class C family)